MSVSRSLADSHSVSTSATATLTMSTSCLPGDYETSPRDTGAFSGVEGSESISSLPSPSRSSLLYASGNGNEGGDTSTNMGNFTSSVPPIYYRSSSAIYDDSMPNVYGTAADCHASKVVGGGGVVDNAQYSSTLSLPHQLTHSSLSSSSSSSSGVSAGISAPLQSSYLPTGAYSAGMSANYHHPHSAYHPHHHHHLRQSSPYSSLGEVTAGSSATNSSISSGCGDHNFAGYSQYLLNSANSSTSAPYSTYHHHSASHPSYAHYAPNAAALYSPGGGQFSLGAATHHYLPPPPTTSPKANDEQADEKEHIDHYPLQQQQVSPVGSMPGTLTRFFTFPASLSSSSLSTSPPQPHHPHQTTESSSSADHANNGRSPPLSDSCTSSSRLSAPSMPSSYFYSNFRSTYGLTGAGGSNTAVLASAEYDYHSMYHHHYGHRAANEPLLNTVPQLNLPLKEDYEQNDDDGNSKEDKDETHLEKGLLKRQVAEGNKKMVKVSLGEHKRHKVNSNGSKAIKCKLEVEENSDQSVIP